MRAVGRQPRVQPAGDARPEVAPHVRRADHEHFGRVFAHEVAHGGGENVRIVVRQGGIFHGDDCVGAAADRLRGERAGVRVENDADELFTHLVGEQAPLSQQLQPDAAQLPVLRLEEDPDVFALRHDPRLLPARCAPRRAAPAETPRRPPAARRRCARSAWCARARMFLIPLSVSRAGRCSRDRVLKQIVRRQRLRLHAVGLQLAHDVRQPRLVDGLHDRDHGKQRRAQHAVGALALLPDADRAVLDRDGACARELRQPQMLGQHGADLRRVAVDSRFTAEDQVKAAERPHGLCERVACGISVRAAEAPVGHQHHPVGTEGVALAQRLRRLRLPPMVMAVTVPPSVSRSCTAASSAYLSKGLTVLGTPARMRVLVFGSMRISVVSGTCLIQTRMFTRHRPQPSSVLPMT